MASGCSGLREGGWGFWVKVSFTLTPPSVPEGFLEHDGTAFVGDADGVGRVGHFNAFSSSSA